MIFWYCVIGVILLTFIALHGFVLPTRFLRLQYKAPFFDRGIRNINEVGGHSILYVPAVRYRKYLKHYALSQRGEKLQLICDFAKEVEYADFQVSVFNGEGKVFQALEVKQAVENGDTEPIDLPKGTAYVSIALNKANNTVFKGDHRGGVSKSSLKTYLLIASFVELLVIFALKICLSNLYGGIFAESFLEEPLSNLMTLAFGLVVVLINNLFTIIVIRSRLEKQVKRDKKNARI